MGAGRSCRRGGEALPRSAAVTPFADAMRLIAAFLTPVADALPDGRSLDSQWMPGGPWEAIAGDGVARR